jgi:hypothetical protein
MCEFELHKALPGTVFMLKMGAMWTQYTWHLLLVMLYGVCSADVEKKILVCMPA